MLTTPLCIAIMVEMHFLVYINFRYKIYGMM